MSDSGRYDGICLLDKKDSTVTFSIADLFLCPDCSEFRFPTVVSENREQHVQRATLLSRPSSKVLARN